jgi:hypothetical protein
MPYTVREIYSSLVDVQKPRLTWVEGFFDTVATLTKLAGSRVWLPVSESWNGGW